MPLVRLELTRSEASVSKTDMSTNSIHKGVRVEVWGLNPSRKSHNLVCYHYTNLNKLNFICYLYKLDKILVILGK